MFLRFISPAIVSPESIDIELPKENEHTMRRGLMVIAKVIQNLANNMFFGKQVHMAPLNEFLKNNIVVVTRFLSDLNVCIDFFSFISRYFLTACPEIRHERGVDRPRGVDRSPLR